MAATPFITLDQIHCYPDTPVQRAAKVERLRSNYTLPKDFELSKGVNVFKCADGLWAWCIADDPDGELKVIFMNLRRHKNQYCAMRNVMRAKPNVPFAPFAGKGSLPTLCKWD